MAYYLALLLISAATLLLELALLRVFAVQQFYHFAFMAISLALLGAGASGSLLSVRRRPYASGPLCLGFGASTVGAYLVINYLPFDSFSIAWDGKQVVYLALYFLAAAVPFIFAGFVIGGELMTAGSSATGSHRVYGANLLGSALGSIGSLLALDALDGSGAVLLAALLGSAAALLFEATASRPWRTKTAVVATLFVLAGLLGLSLQPAFLNLRLSPYKALPVLLQTPDAAHTVRESDATARVDVVESSSVHVMPGLSLLSPVGPPPQAALLLDGDNLMPITGLSPAAASAATLVDYMPQGLAYRLRPGAKALVIEAGTGLDVLLALAGGATSVTAVEENGMLVRVMQQPYGAFTKDLYNLPAVTVQTMSGRVFARRANAGRYDLVLVALTDPHRPVTSGAYSLTEEYVYTVEAFADYLDTLEADGLLVVTRWLQTPPSESARTFAALAAALRQRGRDPARHLLAYRTLRTMTIIAAAQPFMAAELAEARDFLEARNFDAVYYAGLPPDELNRYNVLQQPVYHTLFVDLLSQPEATYATYRFDIRPPSDDRPFFFHYFKWRQTPEILATLGKTWQPFGGSGYFVLVALLLLVALAAAVLIVGPLVLTRGRNEAPARLPRRAVFIYFAALGLGFLFVEVPLAQRFILVLDEPVTALAVVIFAVLLFSGVGSLTVRRWSLRWALGALVLLVLLYPLLLSPLASLLLPLPGGVRAGFTVLALAPLGYLMGLPFAGGLAVVERSAPSLVPWAWAINGTFSVISSVLAVLVALSWGFSTVLWLGAAAYGTALLVFWRPFAGAALSRSP